MCDLVSGSLIHFMSPLSRCSKAAEAGDLQFLQSRAHQFVCSGFGRSAAVQPEEDSLECSSGYWSRAITGMRTLVQLPQAMGKQQCCSMPIRTAVPVSQARAGLQPEGATWQCCSMVTRMAAPGSQARAGLCLGFKHVRGCSLRGPPASATVCPPEWLRSGSKSLRCSFVSWQSQHAEVAATSWLSVG